MHSLSEQVAFFKGGWGDGEIGGKEQSEGGDLRSGRPDSWPRTCSQVQGECPVGRTSKCPQETVNPGLYGKSPSFKNLGNWFINKNV